MLQRGKKSSDALATVAEFPSRLPEPPPEFTEEHSRIWRAVVSCKPVDWFQPDTRPLLAAYCRACVEYTWVSEQIEAYRNSWLAEVGGLKIYDTATKIQERHARVMASLATKMRLTQQSQYAPRGAARATAKAAGARPWGMVVGEQ